MMVRTPAKVKHYNTIHKRSYYEVEKIVSKRVIRGKTFYEVKWVGFDSSENTWQSQHSLRFCKALLSSFNDGLKQEPTTLQMTSTNEPA